MAESQMKPDEYADDSTKSKDLYALQYARYINSQHYGNKSWITRREDLVENEAYRSGTQSSKRIKKIILKGKDKSFGFYDFTPLNIIPKHLKVVKKNLDIDLMMSKCQAIDHSSSEMKKNVRNKLVSKMINRKIDQRTSELTGVDFNPKGFIPSSDEDIDVFMEVESKLPQEIAIEQAIDVVKEANYHDEILNRLTDDVMAYGGCVVKDDFDPELGVVIKRINYLDYVTSYDGSEMNDNRGSFYDAHLEMVPVNYLRRRYGLQKNDVDKYVGAKKGPKALTKLANKEKWDDINSTMVEVMFFEFETTVSETFRKKERKNGRKSVSLREDFNFNEGNISTLERVKPVRMEAMWIVDSDIILNYRIRKNQVIDSLKKVRSSYSSYDTNEMSLVGKIKPFADGMSVANIKFNQMVAAARPKGLAVNLSALLAIPNPDASGESLGYQNIVKRFEDTGIQLFRQDDFTAGQGLPLVELENGMSKDVDKYIDMWNHNNNQINDITGVNPQLAGAASVARVSTESNRIANASSIKAIEYVKDAVLSCEKRLSENIIIRIQDIDRWEKPFKKYAMALGSYNMRALMEIDKLHPFTFSLAIEMLPNDAEKEKLREDINAAYAAGDITVVDKMDVQNVRNPKYASLMLKRRIKENQERKQEFELEKIREAQQVEAVKAEAEEKLLDKEWFYKSEFSKQEFQQDKVLQEQVILGKGFVENKKAEAAFGKELRDRASKEGIAKFNQESMNARQKEKIQAVKEDNVTKDSKKNFKKS